MPLCKRDGFLAIYIRPGKTVSVMVENRRQPMPMLSAFVFSKLRSFAVCVHSADSITASAQQDTDSGKLRGQIDAALGD